MWCNVGSFEQEKEAPTGRIMGDTADKDELAALGLDSDDDEEVDEPLNAPSSGAAPTQGEAAASSEAVEPKRPAPPNVNDGHTGLSDDSDEEFKEEGKVDLNELGLGSDSEGEEGRPKRLTRSRVAADANAPTTEVVPMMPRVPATTTVVDAHFTGLSVKLAEYDPQRIDIDAEATEPVSAQLRWRFKRDAHGNVIKDATGRPIKESNARLVKYKDGSMAFFVGSVHYNVKYQPLDKGVSSRYMLAMHKTSEDKPLLEPLGTVHATMGLTPTNAAPVRLRRKRKVDDRASSKLLKKIERDIDPEKERDLKIREGAAQEKLEKKQAKKRIQGGAGMYRGYLEADDMEFDSTDLTHLKNTFRHGRSTRNSSRARRSEESEDEDDDEISDDEDDYDVRPSKKKAEGNGKEDEEEEDEDDQLVVRRGRRTVEDGEEREGGGGGEDEE